MSINNLLDQVAALREEAELEPDPVHTGEITKDTQIIAIYGKGGSGKSFALANLSYMMAQQGKRVLLIGCDPKSDTTSLLFGGKATPTIIETSSKKKLSGEELSIEDVCFQRDGVFAMELGGPEVGRGCGGRGIIHGFETRCWSASRRMKISARNPPIIRSSARQTASGARCSPNWQKPLQPRRRCGRPRSIRMACSVCSSRKIPVATSP